MSNKEILQQNNTRLSENNIDLASILNIVNGLPEKVDIILQKKTVTPTTEQQEVVADEGYTGLEKVTVEGIAENNLEITPSSEAQNFDGIYTNVAVSGDENLIPDNIKKGTSIFGIEGNIVASNAKITDGRYLFYYGYRTQDIDKGILSICGEMENAGYMFYMCENLKTIDLSLFDIKNLTDTNNMFNGCKVLEEVKFGNFANSKIEKMGNMFKSCNGLITVDLSNFDMSNVVSVSSMFASATALTNLKGFRNLGKGYVEQAISNNYKLNLGNQSKLTYTSLMNILNNIYDLYITYDVANGGTLYSQQITLSSSSKSKLTADEIAIATNKGWTVS